MFERWLLAQNLQPGPRKDFQKGVLVPSPVWKETYLSPLPSVSRRVAQAAPSQGCGVYRAAQVLPLTYSNESSALVGNPLAQRSGYVIKVSAMYMA
mmetsp:Transcript_77529/g.134492  ORF Transcript_77529/g.134492 Transcript_77529/m.134492 type:complete len:96 (-) Transcript_77529:2-289(-)